MAEGLKPCPLCGSRNVEVSSDPCDPRDSVVRCVDCGAAGPVCFHVERAVGLWNRREERTCRNVYEERVHPMDQCDNGFMCSECGNVVQDYEHYAITGVFNYCPNCGAKVVEG